MTVLASVLAGCDQGVVRRVLEVLGVDILVARLAGFRPNVRRPGQGGFLGGVGWGCRLFFSFGLGNCEDSGRKHQNCRKEDE